MLKRQFLDTVPQDYLAKQSRSLWCHKHPGLDVFVKYVLCAYDTSGGTWGLHKYDMRWIFRMITYSTGDLQPQKQKGEGV